MAMAKATANMKMWRMGRWVIFIAREFGDFRKDEAFGCLPRLNALAACRRAD
jgi:hypothetical protein